MKSIKMKDQTSITNIEKRVETVAFYLPQYHPIPENDLAWGKGFTEWNNVVKTQPRFHGHYQPQLPEELGFYDLRLKETRELQANLALSHGISAFCYYSYFLNNKIVLGAPLDLALSDETGIPVCLCWANENWTKAWDGRDHEIILKQEYNAGDIENYIKYIIGKIQHPRYFSINGEPLFLIYSPDSIPPEVEFIERLRAEGIKHEIPKIKIIAVMHGRAKKTENTYLENGYDAVLTFQPNTKYFPPPPGHSGKVKKLIRRLTPRYIYHKIEKNIKSFQLIDYKGVVEKSLASPPSKHRISCIFPSWDNSPRRRISTVIQNNDPEIFKSWLEAEIHRTIAEERTTQAVFINAWNEWAEGCHLEPDQKNGRQFLQVIRMTMHGH